ncbi:Cationic amino acid transporter 4 [Portunus trituberculatus]|uniref:Cationic amino acid transporter 4 n=1 Tax=Portunus trituberculatus TaxID=210409 RepID=A0A5B7D1D1_PORTR|nr:Cationic amino acid transporter 4 [Portunus trituberculatus]
MKCCKEREFRNWLSAVSLSLARSYLILKWKGRYRSIGHMVGAGIYVLTGTVAKDTAGPGIVLSFLLAGLASFLSALCYAEFGARVPKAGSAYVYTYVTVGEFWAFVIGWNIILEHMIGAASVARAWSGYVDSFFDKALSNFTMSTIGQMHAGYLASYPDFLAFFVTLIYCSFLTLGVKGSAYFNSIFTLINLCVMSFVVIVGMYFADFTNWTSGDGFLPFGFSGIISGAATCFYAFVGFDSIATAGEEAKEPAKSIPRATLVSMSVVTAGYVLVGATLTLMVPYYSLNPAAAIPDAFAAHGATWAKYVVSIGALCGMTTTLFGSLFSLPRCVYAMAVDGLVFSWLARVSDKTKVPIITLLLCGFFSALIALLFDIEKLVEFMSIGTLMAYTIVSASVIILRYQPASRYRLVLYFAYGQHHSREGEPVSSYSTLLSEPAPAGNTVFGSVQHTLSHVTAKIASAASEDKKPIVEQDEAGNDDL